MNRNVVHRAAHREHLLQLGKSYVSGFSKPPVRRHAESTEVVCLNELSNLSPHVSRPQAIRYMRDVLVIEADTEVTGHLTWVPC